jgi:hypothetical protein
MTGAPILHEKADDECVLFEKIAFLLRRAGCPCKARPFFMALPFVFHKPQQKKLKMAIRRIVKMSKLLLFRSEGRLKIR